MMGVASTFKLPTGYLAFPVGHMLLQLVDGCLLRYIVIHIWHFLSISLNSKKKRAV